MPKFYKPILFGTVFTTGAAVLIFEVTAVRALSPFFGASIYVVSSVLTVILAALSLGYYFGGRLADRYQDVRLLYLVIATAGLIMNFLYLLSIGSFPLAGKYLSITYGPLILSLLFFFIPAFMLGIDSPFVIKLLTKKGDDTHNGAVVGSTFFWSTVGSIMGSLVSGFVLIPFLGVKLTLAGTATLLSVMACIAYIALYPHTKQRLAGASLTNILMVAAISVVIAAFALKADLITLRGGELRYFDDGYYSQIEVRDTWLSPTKTIRTLSRGINNSSAIELGSTEFLFTYAQFTRAYRELQEDTDNYLVVGGGAYTVPRTLLAEDEDLQIDVVEIEPSLIDVAHEYFELPDTPRLTNYAMDARYFMNVYDNKYDTILLDAYKTGHFIPPHLATLEFFQDVHDHLNDDGVVILNIIGEVGCPDQNIAGAIVKTVHSVFPEVRAYYASHKRGERLNMVLIARNEGYETELPFNFNVKLRDETVLPAPLLEIPLSDFYLDNQVVLTDDLSPVELLVTKQLLRTGH